MTSPTFSVYIHVPFCAVRCGYCDFNTYTAAELGGGGSRAEYAQTAAAEIRLAAASLSEQGHQPEAVHSIFLGGGTPTLLPVADLATLIAAVTDTWGLAPGAEITTEANPDSVTPEILQQLADAGVTRVSFGMQSAVPHVLATLDRTHDPRRIPDVVAWARDAGLGVSLDLIYGTPGESLADWRASLAAAIACDVDHVSAYALVIEAGTKMARQVKQGLLPGTDDDDQAAKYELADELLSAAGYSWYEISNWARTPAAQSQHNLAYWRGVNWWGIGPGAHSHVAGRRWWNVKHPTAYAQRLMAGNSPAADEEILDAEARYLEFVMLGSRLAEGIAISALRSEGQQAVPRLVAEGLLETTAAARGRVVLTLRGRLLADTVVQALTF